MTLKKIDIKKPNLFLVGGVRSGTTSLFEYLAEHPDVFVPNVKGTDCFGDYPNDGYPMYYNNIPKYLSLYKGAKNKKWLLDASHYFHVIKAPMKMFKFNPDSKIIIILRNPFEIIQSQINNGHLGVRGDAVLALKQKNEGRRLLDENLKYYRNLKMYFDVFGRKNVYVILFDDFKKDVKKTFGKLCDFLKITKNVNINFKIYSSTYKPRNVWFKKIYLGIPICIRLFLKNMFSYKLKRFISGVLSSISSMPVKNKQKIPDKILKKLKTEYKKEIEKTSKLLNADLSFWLE